MAAPYKKTAIKVFPRVGEKITRDTLYWKNLEFPVTTKEFGPVSSVEFSPVEPYNYAVTSSTKVQIYSSRSFQPLKTFTKFREVAYSGSFRHDGKLMIAGGDEASVKLFDVATKSLLRVFRGHQGPTHVTKFLSDSLHVLSGSDDKTAKIWDIASESEVSSFSEHQDYIRCGCVSKASRDIFVTGSYDHTVRLFDMRSPDSVLSVDHESPVESLLMFPSGGIVISAGGNFVKVWDVLAGGRLLASFSNHHKTVTSLCFSSNYQRFLSGSLDRHVKVHDVSSYQVVHTLDYPSAILSVGVSNDDGVVVVGMADGLVSAQKRKDTELELQEKIANKKKKKASYRYALASKSYVPSEEDFVVEHKRKDQLSKYDKYFKKFEHTKALDAALNLQVRMKTPEVTVSVMQELIRRGGIKAALAGRDEKSLSILLKFLQKNISNPRFTPTVIDISTMVIDLYREEVGQSGTIDDLLRKLKYTIDQESAFMKQLMEVMGSMDTLFSAAQAHDLDINSAADPSSAPQTELQPSITAAGS